MATTGNIAFQLTSALDGVCSHSYCKERTASMLCSLSKTTSFYIIFIIFRQMTIRKGMTKELTSNVLA